MRLAFFALLVFATAAHAQWRVADRETLPSSPGLEFSQVKVMSVGGAASLHVVIASPTAFTLYVVDDPTGTVNVATAGSGGDAVATVNGGYFGPDHEPLGLAFAWPKLIHPLQQAKLLSGVVLAGPKRVSLLRVAEYKPAPTDRAALQAGPFLIDGGRAVAGLEATRSAARTVLFTAKDGAFGVLLLRSATLAETAQIIATPQLFPEHTIVRALNLDGGSSSGLWVRQPQGAFYSRELKQVRTYLSIAHR